MKKPSEMYEVSISFFDGKYICSHSSGCVGYGDYPAQAIDDFDRKWAGGEPLRKDEACFIECSKYLKYAIYHCCTHNSRNCKQAVEAQKDFDEALAKSELERREHEEKIRIGIYSEPEKPKQRLWWWR